MSSSTLAPESYMSPCHGYCPQRRPKISQQQWQLAQRAQVQQVNVRPAGAGEPAESAVVQLHGPVVDRGGTRQGVAVGLPQRDRADRRYASTTCAGIKEWAAHSLEC